MEYYPVRLGNGEMADSSITEDYRIQVDGGTVPDQHRDNKGIYFTVTVPEV